MTFLIVGAAGNVGGGLMQILTAKGVDAIAAQHARPVTNSSARHFDFDQPATWRPALEGIRKVFLIPKAGDPYPDRTLIPFMDEARAAGVERIVFLTAMALDKDWRVLKCAEDHLIGSGLSWTILRPNWLMQNLTSSMKGAVLKGVLAMPVGTSKVSVVDTRDCAEMAAVALLEDRLDGQALTLTGPESLSWSEVAGMVERAAGHAVRFVDIDEPTFRNGMLGFGVSPYRVEQTQQMMRAIRNGLHEEVDTAIADTLGRAARNFGGFCTEYASDWKS